MHRRTLFPLLAGIILACAHSSVGQSPTQSQPVRAPLVDHHQHFFSPDLATLVNPNPPPPDANLVQSFGADSLVHRARILRRRRERARTPSRRGIPVNTTRTSLAEWTSIPVATIELVFELDGVRHTVGAAGTVYLRRGVVHTYQNFTASDARLLIATTPGGFSELFVEISAATPPCSRMPPFEVLTTLSEKYGITTLGPPMTA